MIVRLHNLSARAPGLTDLSAVAGLINESEHATSGLGETRDDDVMRRWRMSGFHLHQDAWVIVTREGQIVGYADVSLQQESCETALVASVHVHPGYRGRGIGTLFVWLVEERARQLMTALPLQERVTLSTTLNSRDTRAREVFMREGYTLARRFWQVSIAMEEVDRLVADESMPHGRLKVDLVIDAEHLLDAADTPTRTGIYSACQYEVYEKELRPAQGSELEKLSSMQGVGV